MRVDSRICLFSAIVIGGIFSLGTSAAHGQASESSGSLGGYGGTMSSASVSAGMGSTNIAYAGAFSGFMPLRMGGGGTLSFQTRGNSAMGSNRATFSLMSMSGGLSTMSAGKGAGFGSGSGIISSSGSMGVGGGMGAGAGMGGTRGAGVMPPSFGYPFRQPPSLIGSSSATIGMSM